MGGSGRNRKKSGAGGRKKWKKFSDFDKEFRSNRERQQEDTPDNETAPSFIATALRKGKKSRGVTIEPGRDPEAPNATNKGTEVGDKVLSTPNQRENRGKRDRDELSPNDHTDTSPKRDRIDSRPESRDVTNNKSETNTRSGSGANETVVTYHSSESEKSINCAQRSPKKIKQNDTSESEDDGSIQLTQSKADALELSLPCIFAPKIRDVRE